MIHHFERKEGRYYLQFDPNGWVQESDIKELLIRVGLIRPDTIINIGFKNGEEAIVELKTRSGRILTHKEVVDLEQDIAREAYARQAWKRVENQRFRI